MNYKRIYKQLVSKRLEHPANLEYQYTQTHHIIPRSIDPQKEKDKNNLVILSFKEHYIAHALLVKITKDSKDKSKYYKMLNAFIAMSTLNNNRQFKREYRNSNLYSKWKEQRIRYILKSGCKRGQNSASYNKILIHNILTQQQMLIDKEQQIPEGWIKGKSQKNIKRGKQTITYGTKWIYNIQTLQQKLIKKELQLPQGWQYGMSPIVTQKMKQKYIAPTKDKIWITNLQLKENKLIDKNQQLEQGWLYGRIQDFNLYIKKYNDALNFRKQYHFAHFQDDKKQKRVFKILKNRSKNYRTLEQRQKQKQEHIKQYKIYFEQYKKNGWKGVVKNCNFPYSRNYLLNNFKKYFYDQYKNLNK